MGMCKTCNKDAGWLSHECSDCRAQREAAENAKLEADRQAAELEHQARVDAMVGPAMDELKARMDAGATVWLYDALVLDLVQGFLDAAGMDRLRGVGERGWAIVAASGHPSTSTNGDGAVSDFGFDKGQFLIGLAVTAANMQQLDGEIRQYYAARAAEEIQRTAPVVEYPELEARLPING